jgi:hypothetical protein
MAFVCHHSKIDGGCTSNDSVKREAEFLCPIGLSTLLSLVWCRPALRYAVQTTLWWISFRSRKRSTQFWPSYRQRVRLFGGVSTRYQANLGNLIAGLEMDDGGQQSGRNVPRRQPCLETEARLFRANRRAKWRPASRRHWDAGARQRRKATDEKLQMCFEKREEGGSRCGGKGVEKARRVWGKEKCEVGRICGGGDEV